ncbi:glycogen synthase [Acidobacteriota bacterium]
MRIVLATPECVPFIKGSGLADMVGELARALCDRGHEVTILHPYYFDIDQEGYPVFDTGMKLRVPVGDRFLDATVVGLKQTGGPKIVFLAHQDLFSLPGIYADKHGPYINNAERFTFFSRGILEYCREAELKPEIIHCFDWATGLIPPYLDKIAGKGGSLNAGSVYTIFNIKRQGIFERHHMHLTGFGKSNFTPEILEYFGKISFMQAGIKAARAVSTTSVRFAAEICTDEFGYGLENALQSRKDQLHGITNGINITKWNPARDRFLKANYSCDEMVGKRSCKVDLQTEFDLPRDVDVPLLAILPPLNDTRGIDLIATNIKKIMNLKVQLIVIGNGQKKLEGIFRQAAREYVEQLGYRDQANNLLKHKLLGGSDLLLIPSRFEPSGTDHLRGMRYGTIPLVRATGALDDAVNRYEAAKSAESTGFKFQDPEPQPFFRELRRSVDVYRKQRPKWRQLVSNAMKKDYSWDKTAGLYEELYEAAVRKRSRKKKKPNSKKDTNSISAREHASP